MTGSTRVRDVLAGLALAAYAVAVGLLVFRPLPGGTRRLHQARWDPIAEFAELGDRRHLAVHLFFLAGNLLYLVPLAIALARCHVRAAPAAAVLAAVAVGTEVAQYWWVPGRFGSVADVFLYLVGGLTGYVVMRRFQRP